MLKELPHRQFLEWQEYDRLEPIGGLRGDWQVASVCSLMANMMARRSGVDARFTARDFLLEFKEEVRVTEKPKPTTQGTPAAPWQTMKFYAQMYAAQANAEEKKKQQKRKR